MGTRRRRHLFSALVLVSGIGIACATGGTSESHGGNPVSPRIVSLSPHITELLFAAGAGDEVVGVDNASDYPDAARRVPRVGEVGALDVERLLTLKPTLVVVWGGGTTTGQLAELERLNLHSYITEQRHLDDVGTALEEFGRLAGTSQVAERAARRYEQELAALRARYAGRPRLTVFYQVWDRPLYTLSGTHPVSEVLSLCGGENVFGDLGPLAPQVDREAVLARDPQVILIAAAGTEGARQAHEWARFASLRAVASGAVYNVEPALLGRMTPRIVDGVRQGCERRDAARAARAARAAGQGPR